MQSAMRPYVTAGVALVGASVIAVTPIAAHPNLPQMHMPQVSLTASSIDNPINVFKPVIEDAGGWLNETVHTVLANPLPILRQIIDNQLYTARQVLDAAKSAGSALGALGAGLPATLKAVGAQLATGDVNGAIDALITAGLQPILNLLSNPWQALQPALERPLKVAQALIPALYDAGLSMLVGVVVSTVGIGFDTGTEPFLKQIVISTQKVLNSLKTLNPINVINAVQHGIADVLQNAVTQAKAFTEGTFPYIGAEILKALRTGLPTTTAATAAVAAVPTAAATTSVTLAVDASGSAPAATAEKGATTTETATETGATTPSEAASAADTKAAIVEAATPAKEVETAAPVKTTDSTAAATDTKAATTDTEAAESTSATKDAATDSSTTKDADATKGTKGAKGAHGAKGGKGSVTRDSVKAEPGTGTKTGGAHASSGSAGASEAGSAESAKAGAGAKSSSEGAGNSGE